MMPSSAHSSVMDCIAVYYNGKLNVIHCHASLNSLIIILSYLASQPVHCSKHTLFFERNTTFLNPFFPSEPGSLTQTPGHVKLPPLVTFWPLGVADPKLGSWRFLNQVLRFFWRGVYKYLAFLHYS